MGKQNQWVDGRELNSIYKTAYKDEAINQMVEVGAKDFTQRIKVVSCSANDKGLPLLDPEMMPEPLPKPVKDLFDDEAALATTDDESEATSDISASTATAGTEATPAN